MDKRTNLKTWLVMVVFLLGALALPAQQSSGVTTYTDEANFLAAVDPCNLKMESFESLDPDEENISELDAVVTDFLTFQPLLNSLAIVSPASSSPCPPADGSIGMAVGNRSIQTTLIVIDFATPIQSVGLNFVDWGDWGATLLTVGTSETESYTAASGSHGNCANIFFGIENEDGTPISRIIIESNNGDDGFDIDEIYFTTSSGFTCGDDLHPYPIGDLNYDCRVNLIDLAMMATHWMECTHPDCD